MRLDVAIKDDDGNKMAHFSFTHVVSFNVEKDWGAMKEIQWFREKDLEDYE
jgi:hypothetical protein